MNSLTKIIKYSFYDTWRSWWALLYGLFFLVISATLLYFSGDFNKAIVSLLNIVLLLVPLISTVFGVMYAYNSREFTELLLAQPIKRNNIFLGQYLGLTLSLALSLSLGLGITFLLFAGTAEESVHLGMLTLCGTLLTAIFTGLAFLMSALFEDRVKGFGIAILIWLFAAVIYDGLLLTFLVIFNDYPLEKATIGLTLFNPIDLSRILILLRLETAALLGYTGAVFNKFLGTALGMVVSLGALLVWIFVPLLLFLKKVQNKDF
ncbi:ABC transporter permease [Adhaeribacter rhizoryzae]|uniref:ABC transporter permease subunit n=1 Tax=Adhaeribacter rhizoryzae TaxID=2607907 RepID=A0A5M6D2S9_9BACT|nr:ABC transporter permease subunit [Adhaeribacter rhizoryzae]KAA5539979.1 ABC transporter permease subunit [Adhaeribacter rhizoryzae]